LLSGAVRRWLAALPKMVLGCALVCRHHVNVLAACNLLSPETEKATAWALAQPDPSAIIESVHRNHSPEYAGFTAQAPLLYGNRGYRTDWNHLDCGAKHRLQLRRALDGSTVEVRLENSGIDGRIKREWKAANGGRAQKSNRYAALGVFVSSQHATNALLQARCQRLRLRILDFFRVDARRWSADKN